MHPGPKDPELDGEESVDQYDYELAQKCAFDRQELQGIVERAEILARFTPNPRWRRAYESMAQVASTLDAFQARCELPLPAGPLEG